MYNILSSEWRLQRRMIRKTRYDFKVVEVSGRGEREARVEEESRRAHESANPISTRDIPHPPTAGGGCFEALMIISNINRKYCLINVTCLR